MTDHEVIGVLTREPKPVGRKRVLTPSPVHERAEQAGIEVRTPAKLDESLADWIGQADGVAVVAYGLLIPRSLLEVPRYGWVNLHYSLLPQWRGAAPVQYAIAAGQTVSGITTFQIEAGLDTGDVLKMMEMEIGPADTASTMLASMSDAGAVLLSETMTGLEDGSITPTPQQGEPSLAPRLSSADGKLDLSRPATELSALTRAYDAGPGTWVSWGDKRVKIGPAQPSPVSVGAGRIEIGDEVLLGTGEGSLILDSLAPPGKQWMLARDWARGLREEIEWT